MNVDLFTDPERYGDMARWRSEMVELHGRGPIHRIEAEGFRPFWAVIGHEALIEVERRHDTFHAQPETILFPVAATENQMMEVVEPLTHMDEPKHGQYRRLTNDWFKPGRIGRLEGRLDELSRQAVDRLAAAGGSCDFVSEVALPYPLQVILAILGLPEADSGMVLRLTQALFGAEDPDLQRGPTTPEVVGAVVMEFYQYFVELTAQRRVDPTDDLASVIANGRIDGQPLPDIETMSYYLIVATAGHDTTSYAMSGGLRALLEHPAQLEVLRADPSLLNNAVEEMIRWTAPVRHFMRTAQEDTEVAGQAIAAGDWLYLSFTGADFDPSVYDDPLRFDVTRDNADRHLAFGAGVHYCLGAQLARMELRSLFAHLLARVEHIELAESPADSTTTFVGGTKRCPIRYRLTDA